MSDGDVNRCRPLHDRISAAGIVTAVGEHTNVAVPPEYGPISTLAPILAPGSTMAVGWIISDIFLGADQARFSREFAIDTRFRLELLTRRLFLFGSTLRLDASSAWAEKARKAGLLEFMAQCTPAGWPDEWTATLAGALRHASSEVQVVALARIVGSGPSRGSLSDHHSASMG